MPTTIITITSVIIALSALAALAASLRRTGRLLSERQRLEIECARLEERLNGELARQEANEKMLSDRFAAMAADILKSNAESLSALNGAKVSEIIAPVRDNLEAFRRAYTDSFGNETERRARLEQQIRDLTELNRSIGAETRRLGDALKGNTSVQGAWGEMVLDNILERSGLVRGTDYHVQKVVDAADSSARPDVIIDCPGDRHIVVDSKVSLKDYLRMLEAPDRASAKAAGDAHLASVRKHVAELHRKSYQDLLDGANPDFVMMFIPHEGAYLAAMQLDSSLWQTAFDSRVIIVSPTHLVSVVKLVEQMWRQDKQNRHALEIAEIGAKILDKVSNFLTDMNKVGTALDSARRNYDSALTKLDGRGGLRSLAETMRDKGVRAAKDLPALNRTRLSSETGHED